MPRRPASALAALALALTLAACGGNGTDQRSPDIPEVSLQDPRTAPTATPAESLPEVEAVAVPTRAPDTNPTAEPTAGATDGDTYVVQAGDNLVTIAERLGVEYEALCEANGIDPAAPRPIREGETLNVPPG